MQISQPFCKAIILSLVICACNDKKSEEPTSETNLQLFPKGGYISGNDTETPNEIEEARRWIDTLVNSNSNGIYSIKEISKTDYDRLKGDTISVSTRNLIKHSDVSVTPNVITVQWLYWKDRKRGDFEVHYSKFENHYGEETDTHYSYDYLGSLPESRVHLIDYRGYEMGGIDLISPYSGRSITSGELLHFPLESPEGHFVFQTSSDIGSSFHELSIYKRNDKDILGFEFETELTFNFPFGFYIKELKWGDSLSFALKMKHDGKEYHFKFKRSLLDKKLKGTSGTDYDLSKIGRWQYEDSDGELVFDTIPYIYDYQKRKAAENSLPKLYDLVNDDMNRYYKDSILNMSWGGQGDYFARIKIHIRLENKKSLTISNNDSMYYKYQGTLPASKLHYITYRNAGRGHDGYILVNPFDGEIFNKYNAYIMSQPLELSNGMLIQEFAIGDQKNHKWHLNILLRKDDKTIKELVINDLLRLDQVKFKDNQYYMKIHSLYSNEFNYYLFVQSSGLK